MPEKKIAVIIGAGPAGLTAAYEFCDRTDIHPIILESTSEVGGLSKTIKYNGNRMDIGGHRFFSKSTRVVNWWLKFLPLQSKPSKDDILLERPVILGQAPLADPETIDTVMLSRSRFSRIMAFKKFFSYPFGLSWATIRSLGLIRLIFIGTSYIRAKIFPITHEKNLEDFFINRFGRFLYKTFFKSYTEKVWGVECTRISPEWGSQRVKGLSIWATVKNAFRVKVDKNKSLDQKNIETSLIENFMYPKYGPGQMWETVAEAIVNKGGKIKCTHNVIKFNTEGKRVTSIVCINKAANEEVVISGDYFVSTMPVVDLINALGVTVVPAHIQQIAKGLQYRDFMTVGLLVNKLSIKNNTNIKTLNNLIPDNWIYIQEPDVKMARMQIFNNWSPYMVANPDQVWLGLEYYCQQGDALWEMTDAEFIQLVTDELEKLKIISKEEVLDSIRLKVLKAYPAYFGSYKDFNQIREFLDGYENLFLIGRNGMHRYNNQDHSMLTAMTVVDNIVGNITNKVNIWSVNTEKEFHEERVSTHKQSM